MATITHPHYVATLLIWRSYPQLAFVSYAPLSANIGTGSFIALRLSPNTNIPPFGAQAGSIVGFYGRFAILELSASGLPQLQFIAILGHWLELEQFNWDPYYYIWWGGIYFGNFYLQLQPMTWSTIQ